MSGAARRRSCRAQRPPPLRAAPAAVTYAASSTKGLTAESTDRRGYTTSVSVPAESGGCGWVQATQCVGVGAPVRVCVREGAELQACVSSHPDTARCGGSTQRNVQPEGRPATDAETHSRPRLPASAGAGRLRQWKPTAAAGTGGAHGCRGGEARPLPPSPPVLIAAPRPARRSPRLQAAARTYGSSIISLGAARSRPSSCISWAWLAGIQTCCASFPVPAVEGRTCQHGQPGGAFIGADRDFIQPTSSMFGQQQEAPV